MKLYYAPGACSLAPHIMCRELETNVELVRVDNVTKLTEDQRNFWLINPKGYVAALELDDGTVLTEAPVILTYLVDTAALQRSTTTHLTRYRLQEWLAFINSELHAGLAPLFNADLPEAAQRIFRDKTARRIDYLESVLEQREYVMGDTFSSADAYLFTVLRWCIRFHIELVQWPSLLRYMKQIAERPAVKTALAIEAAQISSPRYSAPACG
ncbi:glutathione transferase GstA [Vreelandella sp. EE7]